MSEQKIISSLNSTLLKAPIDILDQLKAAEVTRQPAHDAITAQIDQPVKSTSPISLLRSRAILSYLSVAAVFIVIVSGLYYQFQVRALRTILYLDVNPSIAITLSAKEKVLALDARNDDGEAILEDLEFKDKSLEFLTLEIIHRLKSENYLQSSADVLLVSVYSKNTQRANEEIERVDVLLKDALEKSDVDPILIMQTMQPSGTLEQLSENFGISESRLHFIGLLMRFNSNLVLEELVTMTLQELLAIAEEQKLDLSPILTPEVIENIQATSPVVPSETTKGITDAPSTTTTTTTNTVSTTTASTTAQNTTELISEAAAIAIALNYVQGQILKVEFDDDFDDGDDRPEFEIDILVGNRLYELEIDAQTGAIVDVDIDDYERDDDDENEDGIDDDDDDD